MDTNALERFIRRTGDDWGPFGGDLVARARQHLEDLARTPADEAWVAALHQEAPARKELYRHPDHGFMLLAHTEPAGLYRAPHDHGRGWVVYALQRGEIAMSTYARVEAEGGVRLVLRDETVLRAGEARAFLPGDVHDTRCLLGPALLLRLTDRDLTREDRVEHRVTRYARRDGVWTPERA